MGGPAIALFYVGAGNNFNLLVIGVHYEVMKKTLLGLGLGILSIGGIKAATQNFPDVGEGTWFYPYVNEIAGWGVVDGNDDGTFAPARNINRAEFSKMLVQYDKRVDQKFEDFGADLDSGDVENNPVAVETATPPSALYLQGYNRESSLCPDGWEEVDYGESYDGEKRYKQRTCITDQSCTTIAFERRTNDPAPSECPAGWDEVDFGRIGSDRQARTCMACVE